MRKARFILAAACVAIWSIAPASAQTEKDGEGQSIVIKRNAGDAKAPGGVGAWDKVSGNWKSFRGKVRQQWGKLTRDDIQVSKGKREVLVGKIQARYGIDKDKADQQVDLWLKQQR